MINAKPIIIIVIIIFAFFFTCTNADNAQTNIVDTTCNEIDTFLSTSDKFNKKLEDLPETLFRCPVGDSLGTGYHIVKKFNHYSDSYGVHLGIDINDMEYGNTDLGDTIYSIGFGIV